MRIPMPRHMLCVALAVCALFLFSVPAQAAGRLVLVASPSQLEDMKTLLADLAEENVKVSILNPQDAAQVKDAEYAIIVLTAQSSDPVLSALGDSLLTEGTRKIIDAPGGKKLLVVRDIWKNGQELVCFAGHTDADAAAVRRENKSRWWNTVALWFDLSPEGMHGY